MSGAKSFRRVLLTLLTALAAVLAVSAGVHAGSAKADFTLSITPASQSVAQGSLAGYTVTLNPNNGYAGTVTLAATFQSGSGATASFTPATVNSKDAKSTLSVSTSAAQTGTWTITVTGTDGTLSHSASASVTVTPAVRNFTLAATPSSAQVLPGDTAQYGVSITRIAGYTQPVLLAVGGLPTGASASFTPASPVSGNSSTLQVATTSGTPTGTYTVQITGSGTGAAAQTITTQLVVASQGKPFGISGAPSGALAPGLQPSSINLTLSNPNNQLMNVTNLTVTVTGTSAGGACGPSNFAVTQYSGPYPIVLDKGQTADLLPTLGATAAQLPTVQLIDDPLRNQDACKGAQVFLNYTGAGTG